LNQDFPEAALLFPDLKNSSAAQLPFLGLSAFIGVPLKGVLKRMYRRPIALFGFKRVLKRTFALNRRFGDNRAVAITL
jgi:hypothetical protein